MKNAMRALRLFILTAALLVLMGPRRIVSAQSGGYQMCVASFLTMGEFTCDTCCNNWGTWVNYVVGVQDFSPGNQSAQYVQTDCGGPKAGGCGTSDCTVADWMTSYTDSSCCTPDYDYCNSDYDCCSHICDFTYHACVECVQSGDRSDYEFACCEGFWEYAPWCG